MKVIHYSQISNLTSVLCEFPNINITHFASLKNTVIWKKFDWQWIWLVYVVLMTFCLLYNISVLIIYNIYIWSVNVNRPFDLYWIFTISQWYRYMLYMYFDHLTSIPTEYCCMHFDPLTSINIYRIQRGSCWGSDR